jgi:hypothetical protein
MTLQLEIKKNYKIKFGIKKYCFIFAALFCFFDILKKGILKYISL